MKANHTFKQYVRVPALLVLLALIIVTVINMPPVRAEKPSSPSASLLWLNPPNVTIPNVGGGADVSIILTNLTGVTAADLSLSFNPFVLKVTTAPLGVVPGSCLPSYIINTVNNDTGEIRYVGFKPRVLWY